MSRHHAHSRVLLDSGGSVQLAGISGTDRGCPGGMPSSLAASQSNAEDRQAKPSV